MRANGFKKKKGSSEEGSPAWMTTYADMVTLILAFFVLMFSFAVIDETKFNKALYSLKVSFLGSEGIFRGAINPAELNDYLNESDQTLLTYETIKKYIKEENLTGTVDVYLDERGIVLEISDALLFDPAKAELKPEPLQILSYVADLLRKLDNQVIVEGHTDNVPINTYLFASNWELSVARAVVVVRYLVEGKGLDPVRFVASGYGEFHPIASNLTAEGRAKNRRVNIIISTNEQYDRKGNAENEETD